MARPAGVALLYYIRQAIAIARFDDGAIVAASRDKRALGYGAIIWLIGQLPIYESMIYVRVQTASRSHFPINPVQILTSLSVLIILGISVFVAQYGISHSIARLLFGAHGTFPGIIRAMLLGSIVTWANIIPLAGPLITGPWITAILMRVFEEVDGIERMQAFGLAFVTGTAFWILLLRVGTPR
jgi:hypothetical protein